MTILLADGFEDADPLEYGPSGYMVKSTTAGRRGGAAMRAESYANFVFPFPARSTIFCHFASYFHAAPASETTIAYIKLGANYQVSIRISPSGAVVIDSLGIERGRSAGGVVTFGGYTSFEIKAVIHNTAGSIELRVNGATTNLLSATSIDTNNGGVADEVDSFVYVASTYFNPAWLNDVVIWDTNGSVNNSWMGDLRVDSYMPTADGDTTTLTTSTGTDHFALVDEVPGSGSDYVESGTVGNKDLYQVANMTHTPASIKAVLPFARLLKDDAGTRSGALLAKSGGTESQGPDIAPSTDMSKKTSVVELDPNGSVAWTKSAVDALQVGVKVTA